MSAAKSAATIRVPAPSEEGEAAAELDRDQAGRRDLRQRDPEAAEEPGGPGEPEAEELLGAVDDEHEPHDDRRRQDAPY